MVIQRWFPYTYGRWPEPADPPRSGHVAADGGREGAEGWFIPIDIVREGGGVVVRASIPGVSPEDIEVTVEGDVLTIKGQTKVESDALEGGYLRRERRTGAFSRSLRLSDKLDREHVQPKYENGVLTITIPTLESAQPRRLAVAVAGPEAGSDKAA